MPFKSVLQIILRKSVKSLQLVANEWGDFINETLSASALSKARHKLRHTAFIELHESAVLDVMYGNPGEYKTFLGHRLVAVDGSTIHLPNTEEIQEEFGLVEHFTKKGEELDSKVEAKMTVLFDVLNRISISAKLHRCRANDLNASKCHLDVLEKNDLLLADRAFASYQFFAELLAQNAHFVIRCKEKSYEKYHGLFKSKSYSDKIIELPCPRILRDKSFPSTLKVRFVQVILPSGEVEVLATSLLNRKKYRTKVFKDLYYQRWKIETFFHTLKSRLGLENFTGKSLESVYQDFYSTILVSGLESIIISDAQMELDTRTTKNKLKVNKAVSFHAIKSKVIPMVFSQKNPIENREKEITDLFLQNPTSSRPMREFHLRKESNSGFKRRSLAFQKYNRKHVF